MFADWVWPQHDYTPLAGYERSPSPPPQGIWSRFGTIAEKRQEMRSRFPVRHAALAVSWAMIANRLLALTELSTGAVCPTSTLWPAAGLVQGVALGFDATALITMGRRLRSHPAEEKSGPEMHGRRLAAQCLLAASAMLLLLLATAPFATTSLREIAASSCLSGLVVRDLVLDTVLSTGVLLSGLHLLAFLTPTTLALIGGAAFLSAHHNFQPALGYGIAHSVSPSAVIVGISAVVCLALLSQDTIRIDTEAFWLSDSNDKVQHKKRLTAWLAAISFLLGVNYTRSIISRPQDPIPIIRSAQNAANNWIAEAGKSQTANDAAVTYKARYALPPPPHFDQWHDFARKHNSPVIDAFDQIHADLMPFWGLSPAQLRARTRDLLAQTGLGIGGLRIRGGRVALWGDDDSSGTSSQMPGTHAWMMEAYRDMIAPFAASLPDMDLAFNLDDECRVAMPADVLSQLHGEAKRPLHVLASSKADGHPLRGWFSEKAAGPGWDVALPKEEEQQQQGEKEKDEHMRISRSKYFSKKKPRLSVYDAYIAPTCPLGSAARQHKWWDGSRALPEARGGITAATAAASGGDLCDRPDLARLHGFLISPSAFAVTPQAMPIFSQSRVEGFNDILVPSPWHFVDKANVDETTDMAWQQKQDTVFWRGTDTDGFAEGNKWPGFLRARLVNLAKAARSSSLLAYGSSSNSIPVSLPDVDVSFAGNFSHCDPSECRSETATFYGHAQASDAPKTEFQQHWLYRHLIDVDGAGFSGRFLPFVQSQSTAYRATLFRTWYDERLHPWKHYIPLDVSLSGLWDVVWLASKKLIVKQESLETPLAEQIAIDGHDWAAKALRKEDMQVYMFRMLLEWGRLVDDDREELGYDP